MANKIVREIIHAKGYWNLQTVFGIAICIIAVTGTCGRVVGYL